MYTTSKKQKERETKLFVFSLCVLPIEKFSSTLINQNRERVQPISVFVLFFLLKRKYGT